ncbi:MAG: hypothetical protein RIR26_2478 [Pseudomonadota bacterium]|jgi:hypothetical protein
MKLLKASSALTLSIGLHGALAFSLSRTQSHPHPLPKSSVSQPVAVRLIEHPLPPAIGLQKTRLQAVDPEPAAENRWSQEPTIETVSPEDHGVIAGEHSSSAEETGGQQQIADAVFAPCRAIALPERWLREPGFLPRQYEMRFNFSGTSEGEVFKVLHLEPSGRHFPHADRLIGSLFEDCVNRLGQERVIALQQRMQSFQSAEGQAYSFKLEFDALDFESSTQRGF